MNHTKLLSFNYQEEHVHFIIHIVSHEYLPNEWKLFSGHLHVFGMDVVLCFKENFLLDDMLSKYTRNLLLVLYDFGK
jgi:hypothetical protein